MGFFLRSQWKHHCHKIFGFITFVFWLPSSLGTVHSLVPRIYVNRQGRQCFYVVVFIVFLPKSSYQIFPTKWYFWWITSRKKSWKIKNIMDEKLEREEKLHNYVKFLITAFQRRSRVIRMETMKQLPELETNCKRRWDKKNWFRLY